MNSGDYIFLTGGTGFIGSHLLGKLVDRGCRVRMLSRRAAPEPVPGADETPWANERVELVHGELENPGSFREAMSGCRWVFHLAGYAKNWSPDPETYRRLNVDATCRGKPPLETFLAIPVGIYWGWIALRTRSIASTFIQHAALGISLDAFILA